MKKLFAVLFLFIALTSCAAKNVSNNSVDQKNNQLPRLGDELVFPDGWQLVGYNYESYQRNIRSDNHIYICVNSENVYRFCIPRVIRRND